MDGPKASPQVKENPTLTIATTPTVDELEAVLQEAITQVTQLHYEESTHLERRRDAILNLDIDTALSIERRASEIPLRILISEVAELRARIALLEHQAEALAPEYAVATEAYEQALAEWTRIANDGGRTRTDILIADANRSDALNRAVAINSQRTELTSQIGKLQKQLIAKTSPARHDSAPVVRSIWQVKVDPSDRWGDSSPNRAIPGETRRQFLARSFGGPADEAGTDQ